MNETEPAAPRRWKETLAIFLLLLRFNAIKRDIFIPFYYFIYADKNESNQNNMLRTVLKSVREMNQRRCSHLCSAL